MEIRIVTDDDTLVIKSLIHALGYDTPTDDIANRIEQYADSDDAYVFVAEEDNAIVGLIAGYVNPYFHRSGNIFRIMVFIVSGDYRRGGIGTALCKMIEKIARERECDRIEVTAGGHRTNGAHSFYTQAGFSHTMGSGF